MSIDPFATVQWDLVPGRTVVVVIDPQNDFLHPEGWYATHDIDIAHMRRSVEPTKRLAAAAREKRIPVVWTRHGFRDERDGGVLVQHRPFLKEGGLRIGSWGYQILDELAPQPDDWFVEKNRLSAFFNTNL